MRGSTESRRTFSLPPALTRSAPREVGLTAGGLALTVAAWLLAAGAIAGGIALRVEAQRQSDAAADFERRGVAATAVIDRLWRKSGDGKPAFAAFHFDAGGNRVEGESRLPLSVWRQLRTGSTVPVRYHPDDPSRFSVAGARRNRLPSAVAYLVSSALATMALLCAWAVRQQRTLLSEGRPASAVVTAVRKHQGQHGTHREMVYEFPVLAGTVATGKATASKKTEVGVTISVVYDPERPTRNRPYPFPLVTLDHEG